MFGVSLRVASPVRPGRPGGGGYHQQQTGSAPATPSKCSKTSDYGALAAAVAGAAAAAAAEAGSFQQQQQSLMTSTATASATPLFDDGRGGLRNSSSSSVPLVTPLARPGPLAAPAPPRKNNGTLFDETRADLGAAMATAAAASGGSGGGVFAVETSFAETTTAALLSSLPPPPSLLQRPHPASAPERRGRPPRPPAVSRSFARVRVRRTLDMRAGSSGSGRAGSGGGGGNASSALHSSRDPLAPLPAATTKVRFHATGSRCSLPPAPPPSGFLSAASIRGSGRRRADTPGCCGGRLSGRRLRGLSGGGGDPGGAENDIGNRGASDAASAAAAAGLVAKLSLDGL